MLKNSIKDIIPEKTKFNNIYRGVVEDNIDPLKIGRVRVRIFGLHTDIKEKQKLEGIPTDELCWACPCMPIAEGSISGFGMWSVPLQGSHVMLFFENGNILNPMYFASVPGIPVDLPNTKKGFNDPNGVYPTSNRIGESDVHRLARGESSKTIVEFKNNNLDVGVPTALGGSFSEPSPGFNPIYPNNIVFATHGGVIIELDSTPGSTRFQIYHPSNSYIEINNDGTMVVRNEKDKYVLTIGKRNKHVGQDENNTVDGNRKDKIGKKMELEIEGDSNIEVTGNVNETFKANQNTEIVGSLNVNVTGNVTLATPSVIVNSPSVIASGTLAVAEAVSLGTSSPLKKMMNSDTIDVFNAHTHNYTWTDPGGNDATDPPNEQLSDDQATSNTTAS